MTVSPPAIARLQTRDGTDMEVALSSTFAIATGGTAGAQGETLARMASCA